jgi:hypothetical protein
MVIQVVMWLPLHTKKVSNRKMEIGRLFSMQEYVDKKIPRYKENHPYENVIERIIGRISELSDKTKAEMIESGKFVTNGQLKNP